MDPSSQKDEADHEPLIGGVTGVPCIFGGVGGLGGTDCTFYLTLAPPHSVMPCRCHALSPDH